MQPNEQQIYNQQKKLQEQNSAQMQQAKLQVRTEIMEHVRRFLTQKEENIIDKEAIDENARAHQQIYQQNEVFFKALNEKILPVMSNGDPLPFRLLPALSVPPIQAQLLDTCAEPTFSAFFFSLSLLLCVSLLLCFSLSLP